MANGSLKEKKYGAINDVLNGINLIYSKYRIIICSFSQYVR